MMKNKGSWAAAKINFKQLLPAYIVTACFILVGVYNIIACLMRLSDNFYVDMANYLYILAVMAPIMIVSRNFKKIMFLDGNKRAFYLGALINYGIIAAAVSLICIIFLVVTKAIFGSVLIIQSLVDVFGWWNHGIAIAFIQQFVFLLLVEVFIHTLTSMQTRWYGWLIDAILVVILCTFIPITELRNLLISFFNMIIFNSNIVMQIASCLVLSAGLYLIYLPILRRKEI